MNNRNVSWINTMIFVLSTAGLMVLASCTFEKNLPDPAAQGERNFFSASSENEDGANVYWGGYSDGYLPGQENEFDIGFNNQTQKVWEGRYCLLLMAPNSHLVMETLDQRDFSVEPGVGFSDTINVRLPEGLDPGAYGLAMVVHRPTGPAVNMVTIEVGDTIETQVQTTQQDMDAALAACPSINGVNSLVDLAIDDLAQKLGVEHGQIEVQTVEPTEFSDTSLGVPEPGMSYAQVITPGYIIELVVDEKVYHYHGADDRVVAVP